MKTLNDCEEVKRSFSVEYLHPLRFMLNNMFSRQSKSLFSLLSSSVGKMLKGEKLSMSPLEVVSLLNSFNSELGKTVEMPSANANCSARGQIYFDNIFISDGNSKKVWQSSERQWQTKEHSKT